MHHSRSRPLSLFLWLLLALAWPGGLLQNADLQAQAGTVGGTVVNVATSAPLEGVVVTVQGTSLSATTDQGGRFRITGVTGNRVTLSVTRLGWVIQSVQVPVGATNIQVSLERFVVQLDALVVTGTAGDTRKRVLGNSVSQIDVSAVEVAPVQSFTELLNGRSTGVVVQQGSGVAGSTSEIRIRGRSSLREVSDAPLIYIDGIRVNNRMSGGFGDPATSRLDDIDPSSIASIEIIKGPAAATLYGTEASNGVIQIITKKGSDGPARWNFTMRQGMSNFHNAAERIPVNYWTDPSGTVVEANMVELEEARGTPIFGTGREQFFNLSVAGGTQDVQYFLAGSGTFNKGVTPDNDGSRYNAQLNLSAQPSSKLSINANTGIVMSRYRLPAMGNAGMLPALNRGSPSTLDEERRGWQTAPPEVLYKAYHINEDVNRLTGGITVEHQTTDWLKQRLTLGMDFTDLELRNYTPRLGEQDAQFFAAEFAAGSKEVQREEVLYTTIEYTTTASLDLTESLASNTSGGFQIYQRSIEFMEAEGQGFPATGVKTIAGAGTFQRGRDNYVQNNTVGFFIQQQFGWNDRLFLTAAVRADDNSAFGSDFDVVYYPKLSGSWVISEEPFWGLDLVNSMRLRAAYGESGQQPDAFAALRTFEARANPAGTAAVTPQSAGNPSLGPERGKEIELGFDFGMLRDRFTIDFTYYNQKTTDAILSRNVAPSTGFAGTQFVNVGQVSNSGFEIGVQALLIDSRKFDWEMGFNFNTNNNNIDSLGIDGWLDIGWTTRHQEGYPVGSFFSATVLSADLDADGNAINALCDDGEGGTTDCEDAPWVYQGHPSPSFEGSVNTTLSFLDRVNVRAMLDFQVGQSKYVTDRWNRCAWRQNCEINAYPQRFGPTAVYAAQNGGWNEWDWWIQESSFARLREISVEYSFPDSWSSFLKASSGSIAIGGRNLGLWTVYPHVDPETMDITNSVTEPNDQSILPPLRQFSFTLRLTY
jgi:TonB-linked SusC/RagA family outer membrane protein